MSEKLKSGCSKMVKLPHQGIEIVQNKITLALRKILGHTTYEEIENCYFLHHNVNQQATVLSK